MRPKKSNYESHSVIVLLESPYSLTQNQLKSSVLRFGLHVDKGQEGQIDLKIKDIYEEVIFIETFT